MVGRVVRIIHSFSERVTLFPVIIRLLCKVWLEKDDVFVHLHKLLVAPLPHHTPPDVCREITLARVATVCDICHNRLVTLLLILVELPLCLTDLSYMLKRWLVWFFSF